MTENPKKNIGDLGEDIARQYLLKKGYKIITQNIRWKRYEIDLIVQKDDWLVFVEVKTRKASKEKPVIDSINTNKLNAMNTFAYHYIKEINWEENIRFDAILIQYSYLTAPEIEHIENLRIE